jgi:hypothetical protein
MGGVPIPGDWSGDKYVCICVTWPDSPEWIGIWQGLMTLIKRGRYWNENTGSIKDVQAIAQQLWEWNMKYNPCGGGGILSYDPETGRFWVDTDGDGEPDTLFDPDPGLQETGEDIPEAGGAGMACIIAQGVVDYFTDQRDQFCDLLDAGADVLEIAAAIAALVGLMIPVAEAVAAFIALAAAIAEANSTIIGEQLNDDTLDILKCIIFDAVDDDGTVSPEEFQDILTGIDAEFTGLQHSIIWNMITYIGPAGVQNCCTVYQVESAECNCAECPVFQPLAGKGLVYLDETWQEVPVPLDWRLVQVKWGSSPWDQINFHASDLTGPCPDNENCEIYFDALAIESGSIDLRMVNVEGEEFFAMSAGGIVGKTANIFSFNQNGQVSATIRARGRGLVNEPEWTPAQSTKQVLAGTQSRWLRSDSFWSRQRIPDDGSNRHIIGMLAPYWVIGFATNSASYLVEATFWGCYLEGGGNCDVSYWDGSGEHETTLLSLIGQTIPLYKVFGVTEGHQAHMMVSFSWP